MTDKSKIGWLILGAAIGTAVGMIIRTLLNKYIFQKLGIQTARRVK